MKKEIYILLLCFIIFSCKKNEFESSQNADEFFFLRNDGADMPVWVKGNTQSGIFLLVLHGGPGSGSVGTFTAVKSFEILEQKYAVIYWDQRSAGTTKGHYSKSTINANQYVVDLEKLVLLIKNKYGSDISLFLHGGSWGGYLGFAYLLKDNNQKNIKGFIDESGAHNISLTGNAERRMLIQYGNKSIQNGSKIKEWKEIVNWCTNIDSIVTTKEFDEINDYAFKGTNLLRDSINSDSINYVNIVKQYVIGPLSISQSLTNQIETNEAPISINFIDLNLSPLLHQITLPTLIIGGKHDLVVPNEVLYDAFNRISSADKELLILNKSGHSPSSAQPIEYSEAVINFIEKFK